MEYEETILGGVTLRILSLQLSRTPRKIKQVIGRSLSQTPIVGSNSLQREISINGIVIAEGGNTLLQNKNAVLALDDCTTHTYTDGVNDGTYFVVPGSIEFTDDGGEHVSISRYTMLLVEE